MVNNKEEACKALDQIISETQETKRILNLLSDEQCSKAFHEKSHEVIDERINKIKDDIKLFIHMNSIINKFLEITNTTAADFFKTKISKTKTGLIRRKGKIEVSDARRVFAYLFIEKKHNEALSKFLNVSRSSVMSYKRTCKDLIQSDKKFKEYYNNIIKKLNLDNS